VPFVGGVTMLVVQVVEMATVLDGLVSAALAMDMVVALVNDVGAGRALVPVVPV
jgi:hypothetical protein